MTTLESNRHLISDDAAAPAPTIPGTLLNAPLKISSAPFRVLIRENAKLFCAENRGASTGAGDWESEVLNVWPTYWAEMNGFSSCNCSMQLYMFSPGPTLSCSGMCCDPQSCFNPPEVVLTYIIKLTLSCNAYGGYQPECWETVANCLVVAASGWLHGSSVLTTQPQSRVILRSLSGSGSAFNLLGFTAKVNIYIFSYPLRI